MSLAFLIPAALAALAALLLPLLIHLARRSEQHPTEFAALRWLRQKPKPRHRIRFDEWPLLLVRLLLLVLFALLLARPVLFGSQSHAPYVAVAPGVEPSQARAALTVADARWHWLAPGFPELKGQVPASTAPVSSLLRELDASLPVDVPVTVFVPSQLDGVDAQRIVLARKVDWRVLPSRAAEISMWPPSTLGSSPCLIAFSTSGCSSSGGTGNSRSSAGSVICVDRRLPMRTDISSR